MDKNFILFLLAIICISCQEKNMKNLPNQTEEGFWNAVIEIPAGTNKKYEFSTESIGFEIDQRNGEDRVISFLPYFGNYGFIPSTISEANSGGDGDPLDVILLCESLPQGTIIPFIPIGTVKLMDNQEEDFKIIAVPADEQLNVLGISTFKELQEKHPSIIQIIELWLKNYDTDKLEILGWLNSQETNAYIEENKVH